MRRYSIGRDATADIPVADTSVSRLHADIAEVGGGRLSVTDRGSSNGTYILQNGIPRQIQSEQAAESDTIRFGSIDIAVADLLDIVRRKSSSTPPAAAYALAKSQRLVRCDCGAVKPATAACPFCAS